MVDINGARRPGEQRALELHLIEKGCDALCDLDADEILVLADGLIAERGTHRDLLARNGLYAQMYRRQLLEEELEVDEGQEEHQRRVQHDAADDA